MMVAMGQWIGFRLSAGAALTCAVALSAHLRASGDAGQSASDIFASYSDGEFERAEISLRAVFNDQARLRAFKRDLDVGLKRYPAVKGAAFALESAAVAIIHGAENPDPSSQVVILDLLEAGCRRLGGSRDSPAVFERDWHLAALALLAGPGSALLGGVERPTWFWHGAVWLHQHVLDAHARRRFPADPEIAFAWGISRELEVHAFLHSAGVSLQRPGAPLPAREKQQHGFLRDAAIAFDDARKEPTLRAQATLRLGRIRELQGQNEQALHLWREVASSPSDTAVRYLAYLFQGRALSELKRWPEATSAFQQALSLRPEDRSARLALAAFDYLANRTDDAADQIKVLLSSATTTEDAWSSYLAPGYREWPARLQSVRAAVRLAGGR